MNSYLLFFIITIGLNNLVSAIPYKHSEDHIVDYHAPAHYEYKYGVNDPKSKDNKEAWESRDNGVVKGSYSLVEPDGSTRVVEYTADKHNGFSAIVKKISHDKHEVELWGYGKD